MALLIPPSPMTKDYREYWRVTSILSAVINGKSRVLIASLPWLLFWFCLGLLLPTPFLSDWFDRLSFLFFGRCCVIFTLLSCWDPKTNDGCVVVIKIVIDLLSWRKIHNKGGGREPKRRVFFFFLFRDCMYIKNSIVLSSIRLYI